MVYSNKFVMAVLVNGEPQKELANGVVKIPFNSEYTLRFRNKNNRRAVVKIFIDGEDVGGAGYVINPHDAIDIRRHSDVDRAFKFVSLDSAEAVEFGKNGPNEDKQKGVIEARFYLEKQAPPPPVEHHHHHHHHDHHHYPRPWYNPYPAIWQYGTQVSPTVTCSTMDSKSSGPCGQSAGSYREIAKGGTVRDFAPRQRQNTSRFECLSSNNYSSESIATTCSLQDAAPAVKDGCTVEGNTTGQTFSYVHLEYETDFVSLKVFLQGYDPATQQVIEPGVVTKDTNKSKKLKDLEAENEELRRKLAEAENEKLKAELEKKKVKEKKKPMPKKKASV